MAEAEPAKTLTIKDNGSQTILASGEVIKLELTVQGGTGYDWHLDQIDESRLKLIGEETKNISPKGVVGGPVLKAWTFKAIAPGDTVLRLLYYRVWEGKEKALKKFEATLHITGN